MSVSSEVLKESESSYAIFKTATGEAFAAYLTPAVEEGNLRSACEWAVANLPGGFAALKEIGAFEISFRECVKNGTLQRDPTWLSRAERKSLFVKFNNTLSAEKAKVLYFGQLSACNSLLNEDQLAQLNRIGGESAFKMFMEEA